jgi:putative phosphoesterase
LILHAGDIGAASVVAPFEEIATTLCVRGNIDSGSAAPDVLSVHVTGPEGYELRILMTHIALYGPKLRRDAKRLASQHKAHLFVCGHSHVPFLSQEGETVIFNPGSIGPRRFSLPICFGLMELGPGHTKIRHIDCESGDTWLPPAC